MLVLAQKIVHNQKIQKGISPLIATVLLVAFVVSIGGILYMWGTGHFKGMGERIKGMGSKAVECVGATLLIDPEEVTYNFSGGSPETLEVFASNVGSQELYNFTFLIETSEGVWEVEPDNQRSAENPLLPGEAEVFKATIYADITGEPKYLRIKGTCQGVKIELSKVPLE